MEKVVEFPTRTVIGEARGINEQDHEIDKVVVDFESLSDAEGG